MAESLKEMGPTIIKRTASVLVRSSVVPLALFGIWYGLSAIVGSFILPFPHQVLEHLVEGVREGWLANGIWVSMNEALTAFAFSIGLGLPVGLALGSWDYLARVFEPMIMAVYGIPKVLLYPAVLLFFGLQHATVVFFGFLHGFFPAAIFAIAAVRAVAPIHMKLARALHLNFVNRLKRIVIPSSLPELLAGMRLSLSLCFLGVIVGEMLLGARGPAAGTFVTSGGGAGQQILTAVLRRDLETMLVFVLVVLALSIVLNTSLMKAEALVQRRRGGT